MIIIGGECEYLTEWVLSHHGKTRFIVPDTFMGNPGSKYQTCYSHHDDPPEGGSYFHEWLSSRIQSVILWIVANRG
jgi:hypothetical protein